MESPEGLLAFGDLVVDLQAWEVRLRGVPVALTKTEFEVLAALASRPRRVVTNEDLMAIVWGENWFGDDGNLAVQISKLRGKLGESGIAPRYVRTVRGVGYRFEPEPTPQSGAWSASGESPSQPSISLLVSTDRAIQWVSPQVRDLLGWNPEDLIGVVVTDLAHGEDRPALLAARPILDAGQPLTLRARFRTASGSFREIAPAVRPVFGAEGSLTGFLAEMHPMESADAALELTPITLKPAGTEGAELAVTLTFDADFILTDISPRVPIFDWLPEEIIGHYFSPSDRDEAAMRSLAEAFMSAEVQVISGIVNVRCRDGSLVAATSHTSIDRDDGGAFAGYTTTLRLPASTSKGSAG